MIAPAHRLGERNVVMKHVECVPSYSRTPCVFAGLVQRRREFTAGRERLLCGTHFYRLTDWSGRVEPVAPPTTANAYSRPEAARWGCPLFGALLNCYVHWLLSSGSATRLTTVLALSAKNCSPERGNAPKRSRTRPSV
jgi:hypothetical protein